MKQSFKTTFKTTQLFKVESNSILKLNNTKGNTNSKSALNSPLSVAQSKIYFSSLKTLLDKNDFEEFFSSLEVYLPHLRNEHPGLLLSIYQCWLLLYKATLMTAEYEMVFAKSILPLCLQYPEQMHKLKTKQLYSYLGNSKMIIKDEMRFKALVEQYIDRVLLFVNSLIINGSSQSQMDVEAFQLIQIENQMVDLFQISNPMEYFLKRKTKPSSPLFESQEFTSKQHESLYNPLSSLSEIPFEDDIEEPSLSTNSISYVDDPHSNFNLYSKQSTKKKDKVKSTFKSENPFLKDFNPKFLKKENIDKKILRRFRAYIKEIHQKTPNFLRSFEKSFWNDFSDIKLLPPMKYTETSGKIVEFKSFNTKYFIWLFSKRGAAKLFQTFALEQGNDFLNSLIENYQSRIAKEDGIIEKLRDYLIQIPRLYSKPEEQEQIEEPEQQEEAEQCDQCTDEFISTCSVERSDFPNEPKNKELCYEVERSDFLNEPENKELCCESVNVFTLDFPLFDNTACPGSPVRQHNDDMDNTSLVFDTFNNQEDEEMWIADKIKEVKSEYVLHTNCC